MQLSIVGMNINRTGPHQTPSSQAMKALHIKSSPIGVGDGRMGAGRHVSPKLYAEGLYEVARNSYRQWNGRVRGGNVWLELIRLTNEHRT